MTIARVPFQPVRETQPSIDSQLGLIPTELKILIIKKLGIQALANLSFTSAYWNYLVADDLIWSPIADLIECPLQNDIPIYRQVVSFMMSFRDKLIFIHRCADVQSNPKLLSPLVGLTKAELDRENEEASLEPTQKRAHLEISQAEEAGPDQILKGLTLGQFNRLQVLFTARNVIQVWNLWSSQLSIDLIPPVNISELNNPQAIIDNAEETLKLVLRHADLIFLRTRVFLNPRTFVFSKLPAQDKEIFSLYYNNDNKLLDDSDKITNYLVSNYLTRNPRIEAPDWIRQFTDLKELTVSNVTDPKELTLFSQLRKVCFGCTYTYEVSNCEGELEALSKLPHLQELVLSNINFPAFPKENHGFPCLQILKLEGCKLKEVPKVFFYLPKLRSLDLCRTDLGDLPEWIGNLNRLDRLSVRGNQLTTLPREISRLKNLKVLDLGENPLSAEFLQKFPTEVQEEIIQRGILEGEKLALFNHALIAQQSS